MPPASGDHGISARPCRSASGTSSFSTRRSSRLYGGCSLVIANPAALVAHCEAFAHVPGRVGRAPDVHDLAGVDEVVERPQRLLRVDLEGRTVELIQVDVVGPEAAERRFARPHDVPPRRTPLVPVGPRRQSDLGRQHDVVAAAGPSAAPRRRCARSRHRCTRRRCRRS